jgi:hypothetical protein
MEIKNNSFAGTVCKELYDVKVVLPNRNVPLAVVLRVEAEAVILWKRCRMKHELFLQQKKKDPHSNVNACEDQ